MGEIITEGKTLFLVSHSEADLRRFCSRGLYLREGSLITDGPIEEALEHYNDDIGKHQR
jgi:ABC-2 type transport system ATP-binding protein